MDLPCHPKFTFTMRIFESDAAKSGPSVPTRGLSFALVCFSWTHSTAFVVRNRNRPFTSQRGRTDRRVEVLLSPSPPGTAAAGEPARRASVATAAARTVLQENRHPSAQESSTYCDETSHHHEYDALLFQQLCREAKVVPADALRLDVSTSSSSPPPSSLSSQTAGETKAEFDGAVRGVYVNRAVNSGDVIVSIPLSSCLRDDEPPPWHDCASAVEHEDDGEGSPCMIAGSYNPSDWATRLAASLLHEQLIRKVSATSKVDDAKKSTGLWLRLLPDPDWLRSSLPVHWPSAVLRSACCTSLELAVDASYFSRAQAVQDLTSSLLSQSSSPFGSVLRDVTPEQLQRMCEDALDVVQTRSCRASIDLSSSHVVDAEGGGVETTTIARDVTSPLRILAPVFDMINHSNWPSAEFFVQYGDDGSGHLVVRALRDLRPEDQVLIDYGPSARPAYRCLASYGFVPVLHEDDEDDSDIDTEEDEDVAEVYIDGSRYEVTRSTVPEDIVLALTASPSSSAFVGTGLSSEGEGSVRLTPDIAIRLATRLSDVAYQLLLNPLNFLAEDDEGDDNDVEGGELPNDVLSARLAASLRWNQHRILLACALRLRDWAVGGSGLQ
jgi:SET domain